MIRKTNGYLLLLVCVLCSCKSTSSSDTNKESPVIKIDVDINSIGNTSQGMFNDFELIELETNDNCLLENITKAVFVGDDIFILSSYGGNIYRFGSDGHYISKFKQGNGPGELVFATDFHVNRENDRIFVLDVYRKIKEYTLSGTYLKEKDVGSPFFSLAIKNQDVFLFDSNLNKKSSSHLSVYDETGTISLFLPKSENLKQVGFMPTHVFMEKGAESMYVSYMLCDTIYEYNYTERRLSPVYCIDFHNLSINSQNIKIENSGIYEKICKENNYISGIHRLVLLNDHLFFSFRYIDTVYAIYDIKKGMTSLFTGLIKGFPNPSKIVGKNERGVVGMYNAIELKEYVENNPSTPRLENMKLDYDKNPILIILKSE